MVSYNFADRAALVTGGGAGIGAAVSRRLASSGAAVVVADIDRDAAVRVAAEISETGGTAVPIGADVTSTHDVEQMIWTCVDQFGTLDIAINNAGISGPIVTMTDYPDDAWDRVLSINLTAVFRCMRAELAVMRERGSGSIVNVASVMGLVAHAGSAAYVAAKHGVVGLTKVAALDHAAEGIRVNAVGPGFIRTEMITKHASPERQQALGDLHPIGRLGLPEEVSETIVWLASDAASLVTGAVYTADGGWTAR